jgi:hypothetical protein
MADKIAKGRRKSRVQGNKGDKGVLKKKGGKADEKIVEAYLFQ